ncbi:MAG: SOUL family heme-binding protein [Halorhabdus sp.]
MTNVSRAVAIGASVFLAGWIGWGLYSGRSVDSVPYERETSVDGVEIRRYPQLVLAETTANDQITAFRRLFRYISGANESQREIEMTTPVQTRGGTSIAMTAPVLSDSRGGEQMRMAFYLPAEYDPETAPVPTDATVRLVVEPPTTVAVTEFSWYAPERRVDRLERKLLATLERAGIEQQGEPYLLRYDDPWTPPFMRHNEVAVEIAQSD